MGRLRANHWKGQIIGPHGSGKSALLATLLPALEADRRLRCVALHAGERWLNFRRQDWAELSANSLLVIDGYEQLGGLARWFVWCQCRRRRCGLLATAHRDVGLPTLLKMSPQLDLAIDLVRGLLPPDNRAIHDVEIETAWRRRGGNVRETLFDLYDLFELRRISDR